MFEAVEGLTSLNDIDVKAGSEFNGQDIQLENLTESNYADYFVVKQVELVIDGGMYAVKGDKRARLYNTLGAKNIKVPTSIEDKRFDITCIYGTNTLNGETIDELYLLKSPEEVDWTPELEALVLTDKLPLTVGTTKAISVTATPAKAAYTLTWTSDNEEVATVDEDGNVTAVACGTSIITATADNGVKASTAVIVTAADMVDNLASVLSLSEGDLVGISLTDGHVLYVDGSNIYLRDASAAAVLNVTAITPEQSDVINGEVYLQLTHVNRMPVLLPVEGWATAADFIVGQGDEQEPREVAADDLSEGDYADYVILKAVPITLDTYYYTGSETDQLRLFNTFNIADVTLPEEYEQRLFDVEGIYGTNTLNGEIINELYLLKSPLKVQDIPDGIDIVSFDALKNEPAYNLAGQQVSASYKGIVVVAGKKIVRK